VQLVRILLATLFPLSLALAAPPARAQAAADRRPPQRIVSLSPALTESLFALGAGAQVVGVTRFCDRPAAAQALPKVGGYLDPSPEAVLGLRPDLVVVAPSPGNRRPVLALQRLGLETLVLADRSLADLRVALQTLGQRLDRRAEAQALQASMDQRLSALQARYRGRRPPRALLVYGHRPLVVAGPRSFGGELLALLGAENSVTGRMPYPLYNMERVLASQPEVVLDAAMDGGQDPLGFWARWPALGAVRAGRVVVLSDRALRPGPGIVEALEELAVALYPPAAGAAPAAPAAPARP